MLKKKEFVNNTPTGEDETTKKKYSGAESLNENQSRGDNSENPEGNQNILHFPKRQKRGGTIDVWWLYDDGGKLRLMNFLKFLRLVL